MINTEIVKIDGKVIESDDIEIKKIPKESYLSWVYYAEKLGQKPTRLKELYPEKGRLHAELIRRGIIVNTFNLNVENLKPIYFKNEITISKPKRIPPSNISKVSVEEILLNNEPAELKILRQRVIDGQIITKEQFEKEAFPIRANTLINCMGILYNTSTGKIKALKSYENLRDFAIKYEKSFFALDETYNNDGIFEKTTTKTATLTEEVKETKILPS